MKSKASFLLLSMVIIIALAGCSGDMVPASLYHKVVAEKESLEEQLKNGSSSSALDEDYHYYRGMIDNSYNALIDQINLMARLSKDAIDDNEDIEVESIKRDLKKNYDDASAELKNHYNAGEFDSLKGTYDLWSEYYITLYESFENMVDVYNDAFSDILRE